MYSLNIILRNINIDSLFVMRLRNAAPVLQERVISTRENYVNDMILKIQIPSAQISILAGNIYLYVFMCCVVLKCYCAWLK